MFEKEDFAILTEGIGLDVLQKVAHPMLKKEEFAVLM